MIWASCLNKGTVYISSDWSELTGQTVQDASGLGWVDALHSADRRDAIRKRSEAIRTCQPINMIYRLKRFDSKYCKVLSYAKPSFTSDGSLIGYFGSTVMLDEAQMMPKPRPLDDIVNHILVARELLSQNDAQLLLLLDTALYAIGRRIASSLKH